MTCILNEFFFHILVLYGTAAGCGRYSPAPSVGKLEWEIVKEAGGN